MHSQLTVLGGCGAWPEPGRACAGFLLEHDGVRIAIDPALAAENDIAGSHQADLSGLGERFGDVSARNRSQIGGQSVQ